MSFESLLDPFFRGIAIDERDVLSILMSENLLFVLNRSGRTTKSLPNGVDGKFVLIIALKIFKQTNKSQKQSQMDSSSRDQERKNFSVKQITRRVQASYAIEQQKQKKVSHDIGLPTRHQSFRERRNFSSTPCHERRNEKSCGLN